MESPIAWKKPSTKKSAIHFARKNLTTLLMKARRQKTLVVIIVLHSLKHLPIELEILDVS